MSTSHHGRVAVYPGSFDPVTVGHTEVAARASRIFGEVLVAVAATGHVGKQHLFTFDERIRMATEAMAEFPNVRVEGFDGLVVDYARSCRAQALIKGLRGVADFEREQQMDRMNRGLAPDLDTIYLMATPACAFLSSSLVRQVHGLGGDVSRFVTPLVLQMLDEKLGDHRTTD